MHQNATAKYDAPVLAGIGSRETPAHTLVDMREIAATLDRKGWRTRSGGARGGADSAFAAGASAENTVIYVPREGHNGLYSRTDPRVVVPNDEEMREMIQIASEDHPAWERCSAYAKRLHARNVAIVRGMRNEPPAAAVVCWTRDGQLRGGTAMGIRIARRFAIPVFNLATSAKREVLTELEQLGPAQQRAAQP